MDALRGGSLNVPRILMIINFFPPAAGGGVYRPLSFVKYLSRFGWDVTVVTPRPGEFWISDPELEREIPPGARVVRTGSLSGLRFLRSLRGGAAAGSSRRSSSGFAALRRLGEFFLVPDTYVGWAPFAAREAERLCREERFDVVYSTSPPDSSHLAARRAVRAAGIPWVADCRDPWFNLRLRPTPTPVHRALHERLERSVSRADLVLVTTEAHERLLRDRYPWCRIERIPNGFDEDDFAGESGARPPAAPFTITHGGMLTLGRSTRPFLEGLAEFARRVPDAAGSVRVVFIGPRESANEEWVKRFGLEDFVSFEDAIPHRSCVARETRSHVLLLIKHDDERYRGLVPGKLYEYIGAKRPILAVGPEGEASRLVRELRRGETPRIDRPDEIAAAIETMYRRWRDGTLERAYPVEDVPRFSRRVEAERLGGLLERLIGERGAR